MYDSPITQKELAELIPYEKLSKFNNGSLDSISHRFGFVDKFGIFGLPCKEFFEWVSNYANNRSVYDLGCGTGYLAYGIKKTNPKLDVIAIDSYKTKFGGSGALDCHTSWVDIVKGDVMDVISLIENSVVIMSWPDLYSDMAWNVAKHLPLSNELFYIGEHQGGCTANDKFFNDYELEDIDVRWFKWYGIHDDIFKVKRG